MINFIDEVLTQLITSGIAVGYLQGKDIMLDSPDNAISIYETPGLPTNSIEVARIRTFQLVTRSNTYEEAQSSCWDVFNLLRSEEGYPIINSKTYKVVLLQSPFKMRTDDLQRIYFAFNFLVSIPL